MTESLNHYAKYATYFTIDALDERLLSLEDGGVIEWTGDNLFEPCGNCNEEYASHKSYDGARVFCPVAEYDELLEIRSLIDHGFQEFVSDDGWLEYAQTEALNAGVPMGSWPSAHINWDSAIDELRQDWEEITLDGISWWAVK